MKFFIDFRTNSIEDEITLDTSTLAPEMYCEYAKGTLEDAYQETWCVKTGESCDGMKCKAMLLDLNYNKVDQMNGLVPNIRAMVFKDNNVEPLYPKRLVVPPEEFKVVLEQYDYKEGEDFD